MVAFDFQKITMVSLLILTSFIAISCAVPEPILPVPSSYSYSFENSLEGWAVNGTDLEDPPVEWSIERSSEVTASGFSLRFSLNNLNDAGKIWIEREFAFKPNQDLHVEIDYRFASTDWGDLNHFRIITGVHDAPPENAGELVYQGDTGNGSSSDSGFQWMQKAYGFDVNTGSTGKLVVVIGIWGTWETKRAYHFDSINIRFIDG